MNRVLAVVLLAAVIAGVYWFGRDWIHGTQADVPAEDGPAEEPARPVGVSVSAPPIPAPASDASALAIEAVAREGEVLPPIRIGERGRAARFRPEVFRQGMELAGDVLLRGLTEPREVWVRWDAAATRERFLAARFPVPGMSVLESGEAVVLVDPLVPMLRSVGFTARLDGSVLRIGAAGVYPPEVPASGGAPDGATAPDTPRGGG
ncbi:MAG: hypothetical protein U1E39_18810 [Planctomycetota bacterium]